MTKFKQRGVALVIVLSMLLLMSALLVAFMGKVGSERAASQLVAQSFEAKQAFDSAVNIVMSQIRDGTRNVDGKRAWASQPGAIRTFNETNKDLMVYKLYSSSEMQVDGANYLPGEASESGMNGGSPSETPLGFVDLNEPLLIPIQGETDGSVEAHYPIVSPYAALTALGGTPTRVGQGVVEGFVASSITHPTIKTKLGPGAASAPLRLLPMRVKWLYQMKDGSMSAMDKDGKIAGASQTNPPVARVAFWTDDESSKVNVNTASENTYWDTPHVSTVHESGNADASGVVTNGLPGSLALAASQPAAREYQRFPGHPATTNLSPVLRWLYPGVATGADKDFKEAIYRLSPRYLGGYGSSVAGSRVTDVDADLRVPKKDRLFATLDEYWFRPDRTPITDFGLYTVFRSTSVSPIKDPRFALGANVTPEAMERVRFFLTANSRSPDLNLFGMPRICMWPVDEKDATSGKSKRSGYDDLIAFCSTVAGKSYYFTRANPWSTTYDLMTASGGRNLALLDNYLRKLADRKVPGTGASFASKYGAVAPGNFKAIDQILLSIYDYIRCTNLVDTGRKDATELGNPYAFTPGYSPKNDYTGNTKPTTGSGQVIPTVRYRDEGGAKVPAIKGFGRFITLSEAGLMFTRDKTVQANWDDPLPPGTEGVDYYAIRCILVPEMFTPSPGYPAMVEGYAYSVRDGAPLSVSSPLDPAGTKVDLKIGSDLAMNYVEVDSWRVGYGRFFMPTRGFQNQFVYDGTLAGTAGAAKVKTLKKIGIAAGDAYKSYPFFSKLFYLRKTAAGLPSSFKLNPGSLTFQFYPLQVTDIDNPPIFPGANTTEMIQRITVNFPTTTLPIPPANPTPIVTRLTGTLDRGDTTDWDLLGSDVLRTVEASGPLAKGDLRVIAGSGEIPRPAPAADGINSYFDRSGRAGQYESNVASIHNYRQSWGRPVSGAVYGTMSVSSPGRGDKPAKMPALWGTAKGAGDATVTGDFDRGISKHSDGSFINKPDEGNTKFDWGNASSGAHLPYFRGGNGYEEVGVSYFSPNRLIPSAVMFGSLPTGIFTGRPFETLLFSPPVGANHTGMVEPKDHYLLDWFHMPVVEPFSISEPLSTMGKININTRLAPFGYYKPNTQTKRGYIERNTGFYAVLKGMKQMAIATGATNGAHVEGPLTDSTQYRFDINVIDTVEKVINPELDTRKFFRSASEICELDLLCTGFTTPGAIGRKSFWESKNMTGDNQRERAYAQIYPRLTTKSNVFTVHIRAQSIVKNPNSTEWDTFSDVKDRVTGEYRGSTVIERYIDQNDQILQNYDAVYSTGESIDSAKDLERYYRFRILSSQRFTAQ